MGENADKKLMANERPAPKFPSGTLIRSYVDRMPIIGEIIEFDYKMLISTWPDWAIYYEVRWETERGSSKQRHIAQQRNRSDKGRCCWLEHTLEAVDVVEMLARLEDDDA